jgi:DNA-binding response OmpR family regulator
LQSAFPEGLRVLIVEDDEMVSRVLRRTLEAWFGPSMHAVRDGGAAMRELETRRFDVVVTDLKIPSPNGVEVARAAREQEPPAAVVVITGFAEADDEAAIEACGASLLRKPFDPAELEAALRAVLERAGG